MTGAAELEPRIAAWLCHVLGVADVRVSGLDRIPGGASRETWRLVAHVPGADGKPEARRMILRRDPGASLIDTDQQVEFAAFSAFQNSAVPVPSLVGIEEDGRWLDRRFFVMNEITDCQADGRLFDTPEYVGLKSVIGTRKWQILGTIAATDPVANGLASALKMPMGEGIWRDQLDYWEGVIDEDALSPQPIVRAAIRWLRRNPPRLPGRVGIVHGDYRTGNFLFDAAGTIRAVLDWEMCHLGDPLEDLAWAFNPLWGGQSFENPGRLLPRAEAIRLWERASGLTVDPVAFRWWEVFAGVKGVAIWQSAARAFADGANRDPIQVTAGWFCTDPQDRFIMDRLGHLAL